MQFDEEYYKSDDFQELLESYESSMNAGSAPFMDADDLVDIADYYNWQGDFDRAVQVVDYALELYPGATLPNVFKARQALMGEDFQLARQYAAQILQQDDPDYHYLMAEILVAEGHIDEADRYLRDYGMTVDADEYEDFIKDCANLYIDYGISDKAYEWMMRSRGDNSDDFKELMARTLFGLGKFKDSERLFNELIDNHPFSTLYWNALASSQYMRQQYSDSITSSEYAIAIDPNDPDALLTKANSLQQLGNAEEALKYFKRYIKATDDDDPQRGSVYQEMAFCCSDLGDTSQAMALLDQAAAYPCNPDELQVIRGHLLLAGGQVEQAERAFQQAIVHSDTSPFILLRVIVSLYDNHYLEASYTMFRKFFSLVGHIDPTFHDGYSYMALVCNDLGKAEEFLDYLAKAVDANPHEAEIVLRHLFPEGMSAGDYVAYAREHVQPKNNMTEKTQTE